MGDVPVFGPSGLPLFTSGDVPSFGCGGGIATCAEFLAAVPAMQLTVIYPSYGITNPGTSCGCETGKTVIYSASDIAAIVSNHVVWRIALPSSCGFYAASIECLGDAHYVFGAGLTISSGLNPTTGNWAKGIFTPLTSEMAVDAENNVGAVGTVCSDGEPLGNPGDGTIAAITLTF